VCPEFLVEAGVRWDQYNVRWKCSVHTLYRVWSRSQHVISTDDSKDCTAMRVMALHLRLQFITACRMDQGSQVDKFYDNNLGIQ